MACPPFRGGHGRGERTAPGRGPFIACFVLLQEKAVDGDNPGLRFGKPQAVLLGHALVFAGKENRWTTLIWFGLSVCACGHECIYVHECTRACEVYMCMKAPACLCVLCAHV